jgi:hypothetical protein
VILPLWSKIRSRLPRTFPARWTSSIRLFIPPTGLPCCPTKKCQHVALLFSGVQHNGGGSLLLICPRPNTGNTPQETYIFPGEPINWYLEICRLITNVYARMIAAHSNLEGWLLQLKPYITGGRLQAVFHFEHGHRGAHLDRVTL